MNLYMTTGTLDYLKKIKKDRSNETFVLMQNEDTSLLLHETEGTSIFKQPRKYEVVDGSGKLTNHGFAVLNNIPVTDEGRPLFEYRFKNQAGLIENEPGFLAIRILRPTASDTYVIFTLWENGEAFKQWQESKSFAKAHVKKEQAKGDGKQLPQIFPRPSYVTKYSVEKD